MHFSQRKGNTTKGNVEEEIAEKKETGIACKKESGWNQHQNQGEKMIPPQTAVLSPKFSLKLIKLKINMCFLKIKCQAFPLPSDELKILG